MIAIELQFLANRYHGTAWGRHVNEGAGEWPPSPYRLLRAMYDAWKRKCCELPEHEVRAVFEALSRHAPEFYLPKGVAAHTRSYLHKNTEEASDKALIFDGFVALPKGSRCFLRWDVDLGATERRNLQSLLTSLNFLGRSESWVDAKLAEHVDGRFVWKPVQDGSAKVSNLVKVACPVPASQYTLKQPDWFDALAMPTTVLLKQKMSGPPAMRYVAYEAPPGGVTTWLPAAPVASKLLVSAAILEVSGKVLPPVTDTVRVAERLRGRLMRYFEQKHGAVPWMVHGKDAKETPRKDHEHLFLLPRGNRLGRVDHVLVYTRREQGFLDGLHHALANLHTIHWVEPMWCVLSWAGRADDPEIRPMTCKVRSSTPFVTVRHTRKGRDNFLEDEVRRECANHGLPAPAYVRRIEMSNMLRFRRSREGEESRPGHAFEIEFSKPVRAPFSLGYGCHFGLGQFEKAW